MILVIKNKNNLKVIQIILIADKSNHSIIQYWELSWRRSLFIWEKTLVVELSGVLETPSLWGFWLFVLEVMLRWCVFLVRFAYSHLSEINLRADSRMTQLSLILSLIWKNWASSKVQVFSGKLLLDRIPTRVNLLRRRALRDHAAFMCALCGEDPESASYIFVTCGIASRGVV